MCVYSQGRGNWFFNQPELLETLYEALSRVDRSRVKTGKEVFKITTSDAGAIAHCTDGTVENGSIVIGADGVHSRVRDIMRADALRTDPKAVVNDKKPFVATYRALWGIIPMTGAMDPSEAWDCRGTGSSSQLFLGRGRGWFIVYEKLDRPTRERRIYTQMDRYEFSRKHDKLHMTDKLSFRDIYGASHSCGMADLTEGQLRTFSRNRITLIGSAATNQTPIYGLGFNSGVQDVVALTNILRRLVLQVGHRHPISTEVVKRAFYEYDRSRRKYSVQCMKISARSTRVHIGDSKLLCLLDRYIVPCDGAGRKIYDKTLDALFGRGLTLDSVKENEPLNGLRPWANR